MGKTNSGGTPRRTWTMPGKRLIILCAALVVLLVGSAYGAIKNWPDPLAQNKAIQDSESMAYKGNYSGAQSYLAGQAKNATDKETQASYYIQQVTIAINDKKYDDAMKYAQLAEDASHSPSTASIIGQVAGLQGDSAKCRSMYKLAISRLDQYAAGASMKAQQYQEESEMCK